MEKQALEIRQVKVRGGYQLQGIGRSDRGTKYIVRSVDIPTQGKTKEEIKREIAQAIRSFYPA